MPRRSGLPPSRDGWPLGGSSAAAATAAAAAASQVGRHLCSCSRAPANQSHCHAHPMQEGGRGRSTPGRGGRFGTPPPAPPGGRASRGFTPGRGRGPSAFYGSGGRGGPGLGYSPTPQRSGRGQRGSPAAPSLGAAGLFARGRAAAPGRGAATASGSPGGYAVAHSGLGGGKLFGRGQEAVAYDREKEKGVLKVGGLVMLDVLLQGAEGGAQHFSCPCGQLGSCPVLAG